MWIPPLLLYTSVTVKTQNSNMPFDAQSARKEASHPPSALTSSVRPSGDGSEILSRSVPPPGYNLFQHKRFTIPSRTSDSPSHIRPAGHRSARYLGQSWSVLTLSSRPFPHLTILAGFRATKPLRVEGSLHGEKSCLHSSKCFGTCPRNHLGKQSFESPVASGKYVCLQYLLCSI